MSGGDMVVLALCAASCLLSARAAEVTPVQKVIQMMEELKAKGIKGMEQEVVDHTTYMEFCKNTDAAKVNAITGGSDTIDRLKADIEAYNSNVEVLAEEITKLDASTDTAEQEMDKAKQQRTVQKADYVKMRADLTESITQMAESITTLNTMQETTDAASLVQTLASKPKLPATAKRALAAFLQTGEGSTLQAPEGATYESGSGGITDMVAELKAKTEKERDNLDKEEVSNEAAFTLVKQKLTDQIDMHKSQRQLKATNKKEKETASATASGDLADTTEAFEEDKQYLADLRVTCGQQAEAFAARQQMRKEEIEALDKATEIISGGSVSGHAKKHLPQLVQIASQTKGRKVSLVQLRTGASAEKNRQAAAASYLSLQGRKLSSRMLAAVATRVSFDPFVKVRTMIRQMIQKLEEEGNAEADHKAWCDNELKTNAATRDDKTTLVEQLTAQVQEMTAKSTTLKADISDLSSQMAETQAAVQKATEIRTAEKIKNAQTVKEADEAVVAVQRALTVLQEFYAKAAKATAFTQRMQQAIHQEPPKALDTKPYTGQGGEGGILGMLEVILSDFERLLMETTQDEAAADAEYTKFAADSKADTETKDRSVRHKTDENMYLEVDLGETKKDLKMEHKELDAAGAYFEKLKPDCLEEGTSYADRVARRQEEIQSLNEALKILIGDV